jgi:type I restriction enzyme S subunit
LKDDCLRARWQLQRIGDLCELINGRAFKPSDWAKAGLPIVRIQNLNDPTKPYNYYAGTVKTKNLIDTGDVLLSWSGTPGTSFGCFLWDRDRAILNQHIFKVLVNESLCDKEYFTFAVNNVLDEMIAQAHGGVGLRHITKGKLEGIQLPIAPRDEQPGIVNRIKECLKRITEIKRLREDSRKEASVIESSSFADFLEGTANNPSQMVAIGDVLRKVQYGSSAKASANGKGVPILRMGNIQSGHFDFTDLKYIELTKNDLNKYRLEDGDILINRTNSQELVGKAAMFEKREGDWVFASYLIRLVVDRSKALPEFVNAAINSRIGRTYVNATARRAIGMVNINAKEIAKMPLPLPSIEKQREVVDRFKQARNIAQSLSAELDMEGIRALPGAVLSKAFAGGV